ncbi:MAG: CHAT domain-containing protein [Planctomycetes bacterium]|nr:CHAT domain-containing protein [Planctomycetota bacterium]
MHLHSLAALIAAALGSACVAGRADVAAEARGTPIEARESADPLRATKALLSEARAALAAKNAAVAREKLTLAIDGLLANRVEELSLDAEALLAELGTLAHDAGALQAALSAREHVLASCAARLPDEHPNLQSARVLLGGTRFALGDLEGAHALFAKAYTVGAATLPDEHPDLQKLRQNLAASTAALGDLDGARALEEKVLAVSSATLPDDHPDLQRARQNLAITLYQTGELERAHALLTRVVEVRERTLPDDDPTLVLARAGLASTTKALGDLDGARVLEEKVLATRLRSLPDRHPDVQRARNNLAATRFRLGDLQGARELQERVLEVRSQSLPDDHPDVQLARSNLAATLAELGDTSGARALFEKVLEVRARSLPDDHPDLQIARGNLAGVLTALGDLAGARELEEKVLEVFLAALPDDHPNLQHARANLAATAFALGDLERTRELEEQVLAANARALPESHPDLLRARGNLAGTLAETGELSAARELLESTLEVQTRTLADGDQDLQWTRRTLAVVVAALADRALVSDRAGRDAAKQRFDALIGDFGRALRRGSVQAIVDSSSREAEERIAARGGELSYALSFAAGLGSFEPDPQWNEAAFLLSETMRSAALASARVARRARSDANFRTLHGRVRSASEELAALAYEGASTDELDGARRRLDDAERELVRAATRLSGGSEDEFEPDLASLAARLGPRDALVGYRSYARTALRRDDVHAREVTESLCAFVVRNDRESVVPARLVRIELGELAAVERAVATWRGTLGVAAGRGLGRETTPTADSDEAGHVLRALVLDPLGDALAGAERVIVALDGVLHTVPLDALPAAAPWKDGLHANAIHVGECLRLEVRSSLLELRAHEAPVAADGNVVVFGAPDFDRAPDDADAASGSPTARALAGAAWLRGGAWEAGFTQLPGTGEEARGIGRLHEERSEPGGAVIVLDGPRASRGNLFALAGDARWLHLATHGWFAPDSIRSWVDPEPIDAATGRGAHPRGEHHVAGMSPMLLCGLALAGANVAERANERTSGLVTAEELATLDLSNCELAVLSACDTNVGLRRAGQGVASLQRALHMAGARSVITSLWRVPDVATKELMLDFYRRLWVEKQPKGRALWEAKKKLRDARGPDGQPLYTTRDWAAWVLTGEPE